MEKVRWGLVGYGEQVKKRMLPALKELEEVEVRAICCSSPEQTKDIEKEQNVTCYSKLTEFLENPEIDVVYIATPHYLHVPQAFKAIEAGKNVLVEKPMALSVDGANKIIETARKRGVRMGVNFPLRHHPGLQELRKQIQAESLGEPVEVYIHLNRRHYQGEGWWRDQFHAGPMALMDLGVQGIDLLLWLVGERAVEVVSLGRGGKDDESLNIAISVSINFENGTQGLVFSSNLARGDSSLIIAQGTEKQVLVEMNWPEGDGRFHFRWREEEQMKEEEYPSYNLYKLTAQSFSQAVLGKENYSPCGEDAFPVVEACCCAIESLKSQKLVKVGEILRVTGARYKE